jgi:phage tail sheath protein FI
MADPLNANQPADFASCGALAGIIARIDASRGVWKAPTGLGASFTWVTGVSYGLTSRENGPLNALGVNCLRSFPGRGNFVWGARQTISQADINQGIVNVLVGFAAQRPAEFVVLKVRCKARSR